MNELNKQFITQLNNQIDYTLQFYDIQLQNVDRNIQILQDAVQEYFTNKNRKLLSSINQDFMELERTINLLKNFLGLNVEIVSRLIFKHSRIIEQYQNDTQEQLDTANYDFIEKQKECEQNLDQITKKLSDLFQQLMVKSSDKVKNFLISHNHMQTKIFERSKVYNYFNGIMTGILLITTIKMIILLVYATNNSQFEPSEIQLASFRICYVIGLTILSQSIVQMVCQHRINYSFLLELPTNKVTAISYKKTMFISFTYLSICNICFIMYISDYVYINNLWNADQVLSNNFIHFSQLIRPIYWACIPIWILMVVIVINIIEIIFGHKQVQYVILKNYIQIFDIKNPITFYSYIIADVLTSYYMFMEDLVNVVTFDHELPWLIFIAQIIFPTLRVLQQIRKYIQFKHFHPYITNSIKYILSIPALIIIFYEDGYRSNGLFYYCIVEETLTVLVKIYWEIVQDAGLLTGGVGSDEFKNQKNKWKNKILVRRASQLPIWFSVVFILINIIGRFLFLFEYHYFEHFYIMTILIFCELFRRTLWLIYRLDNQQATNCEHYTATRFIPITLQQTTLQYVRSESTIRKNSIKNIQLRRNANEEGTLRDAILSIDL